MGTNRTALVRINRAAELRLLIQMLGRTTGPGLWPTLWAPPYGAGGSAVGEDGRGALWGPPYGAGGSTVGEDGRGARQPQRA
jgi:hypothetical protein